MVTSFNDSSHEAWLSEHDIRKDEKGSLPIDHPSRAPTALVEEFRIKGIRFLLQAPFSPRLTSSKLSYAKTDAIILVPRGRLRQFGANESWQNPPKLDLDSYLFLCAKFTRLVPAFRDEGSLRLSYNTRPKATGTAAAPSLPILQAPSKPSPSGEVTTLAPVSYNLDDEILEHNLF